MTPDEFVELVSQRALPKSAMGRILTLSRELAEGAGNEVWLPSFDTRQGSLEVGGESRYGRWLNEPNFQRYVEKRWENNYPSLDLLISNGYLESIGVTSVTITFRAFNL